MTNIAAYLTTTIGRLTQAIIAFMAMQSRATEITWIGAQAYTAVAQPNLAQPLPAETWHHLTQRLGRLAHRLRTLFARYESNTLPAPRPSRARIPQIRPPQPRLPTRRGWIGARIAAAAPAPEPSNTSCTTPRKCAISSKPPRKPAASCAPSPTCSASPCRNTSASLDVSPPVLHGGSRRGALGPQTTPHPTAPPTARSRPKSAPPPEPGKNTTASPPASPRLFHSGVKTSTVLR